MSHSRITERVQIIELLKIISLKLHIPEEVGFGPLKYNVQAETFTKIMDLTDREVDIILKEIQDFKASG